MKWSHSAQNTELQRGQLKEASTGYVIKSLQPSQTEISEFGSSLSCKIIELDIILPSRSRSYLGGCSVLPLASLSSTVSIGIALYLNVGTGRI